MSDRLEDEPAGEVEWPTDTSRYRLTLPATEDEAALDVLAAIMDASPRQPASADLRVTAGRRADADHVRRALSDLAAHPDVTVGDRETSGAVPITGDTFDALAVLAGETRALAVRDEDGTAILKRRNDRFTFAVPEPSIETIESSLPGVLVERLAWLDD
jgi:hypothetical protein